MSQKIHKVIYGGAIIFLILYFMQFMEFPNSIAVLIGGVICIYMALDQKRVNLNTGLCLLAAAILLHFFFLNGKRAFVETIVYIPLVIYELGNLMVCDTKIQNNAEARVRLLMFLIVCGFTIHGLLNSYMYLRGYNAGLDARQWMDIWKGYFIPGTQQNLYYLPIFACVFPSIVFFNKRKIINSLVIIGTVFFVYMSLVTRSRLSLVVFILVVFAQIVLYFILERKNMNVKATKRYLLPTLGIIILLGVIGIAFLKNTEMGAIFINNMSKDGGIFNNVRFVAQRNVLKNLFYYPMGGMDKSVIGFNYAHNVWLDMAKQTGIIPFALFVLYTVYTIYEMLCFLRTSEIMPNEKITALGLYGVFFLYFFVEPALEASIHYLTPWIFLNGVIHGYLVGKNKNPGIG